jgi:hypothetical protein
VAHPGRARRFHQPPGAVHVDRRHARHLGGRGGGVDHDLGARHRIGQPGSRRQVALPLVGTPGGPPAEHHDVVADLTEAGDERPAEAAGAAGDQDLHGSSGYAVWSWTCPIAEP